MKSDRSIIASRELTGADGSVVVIEIGGPERYGELDWVCEIRISGLGRTRVMASYGVDPIQALQLSFPLIRAYLEEKRVRLNWFDAPFEIGFPKSAPVGFGVAIMKKVEDVAQKELDRHIARRRSAAREKRRKKREKF